MELFDAWCDLAESKDKRKRLWALVEKERGREEIEDELVQVMRSHYDLIENIAEDVNRLGYAGAAKVLGAVLPQGAKSRSGDLGEILAAELVEEKTGFSVPIRRLRYKDGREMALRGDDFIGVAYDSDDRLWLLKGESKSRKKLGKTTITEARTALNRNHGRCTPDSLLFLANRLLDSNNRDDQDLGRTIRDEVGLEALRPNRIDHMFFTLSGNGVPNALIADLQAASINRNHYVVNLHIEDHGEFIAAIYTEVQDLGND
ncbi:Hachiman antiphage defense system protein HamA [Pseudomonas veronii]